MRTFMLAISVLLLSGCLAWAQKTPPGGDMLGSDRPAAQGGVRTSPAVTPDANQRVSGTLGTSSGYEGTGTYAGSSTYNTGTAVNSHGAQGMAGQTGSTQSRRRAFSAEAAQRKTTHKKTTRRRAGRKARTRKPHSPR